MENKHDMPKPHFKMHHMGAHHMNQQHMTEHAPSKIICITYKINRSS
jgi:hypothetical protein